MTAQTWATRRWEADRQMEGETDRGRERQTDGGRETDGGRDRQRERQTDEDGRVFQLAKWYTQVPFVMIIDYCHRRLIPTKSYVALLLGTAPIQ